jgi:N-acetylglucosaminyl-diphospho-decaprenol L-rhamnosyltransferase
LSDALAVVIVTYDNADDLLDLATALVPGLGPDDEVLIVDNASSDATAAIARTLDPRIVVLARPANDGFAAGARAGVAATTAPLVLLLNPDARPQPGALERLRNLATERSDWAAWQPAVMLPDGRVNTSGGVVHYLAIGWAGQCEQPATSLANDPHEIAFASGAALVIRRSAWELIGGLEDSYFLYGEDLDLGLRLWLSGQRVGVEPRAQVIHHYEFDKGNRKWLLLERNRWRTLLAVYPVSLLIALAPALLISELGLLVIAARNGWLLAKLRAQFATLTGLPATLRRRRIVQAQRHVSPAVFAAQLTGRLDSPNLPMLPRSLDRTQAAYWRFVRLLLR